MSADTIDVTAGPVSYSLAINTSDSISSEIRESGRPYEYELLQVADTLLKERDVVLDVGANLGNHATYFSVVCGAEVVAFEPNPEILPMARANAESHSYSLFEFGLGSCASNASVSVSNPRNIGGAVVRADPEGPVKLVPLDTCDIPRPVRLMKIDIEGAELDALQGALQILTSDIPILIIESHSKACRKEVEGFLRPIGYWRLPVSLAATPTYIYAADLKDLLTAVTSRVFVRWLLSRAVAAARWALRAFKAFLPDGR